MSTADLREKVITLLESIRPDIREHLGTDLMAAGIINSLDVMHIVPALEDTFSIELYPEDVSFENFSSVETIADLVKKRGSGI
jgi:acyl carrier protein